MSIADHFHNAPDAGFVRNFDAAVARRQFRISLVLVALIAMAAAALAGIVRFDGPTAASQASVQIATPPAFAGKL